MCCVAEPRTLESTLRVQAVFLALFLNSYFHDISIMLGILSNPEMI